MFNPSYIGARHDILRLIPSNVKKVLDIGCSTGKLGQQIKQRSANVEIHGLEHNEHMAKKAENYLDRVIIGDIEKINLEACLKPQYFDCIIFGDILEHLIDPWEILKNAVNFLNDEGVVIASIPNVRHYNTIIDLLIKGYWPYRNRGIHDKTHLRFFTIKNIQELFHDANLEIVVITKHYRIVEKTKRFSKYTKYLMLPLWDSFFVFQYLIVARKQVLNKQ